MLRSHTLKARQCSIPIQLHSKRFTNVRSYFTSPAWGWKSSIAGSRLARLVSSRTLTHNSSFSSLLGGPEVGKSQTPPIEADAATTQNKAGPPAKYYQRAMTSLKALALTPALGSRSGLASSNMETVPETLLKQTLYECLKVSRLVPAGSS